MGLDLVPFLVAVCTVVRGPALPTAQKRACPAPVWQPSYYALSRGPRRKSLIRASGGSVLGLGLLGDLEPTLLSSRPAPLHLWCEASGPAEGLPTRTPSLP